MPLLYNYFFISGPLIAVMVLYIFVSTVFPHFVYQPSPTALRTTVCAGCRFVAAIFKQLPQTFVTFFFR